MKKLLFAGAALFGLYWIYTKTRLNFKIVGLKFTPNPVLTLQGYNPTSLPAQFSSLVADVMYKGTRIGIINQFKNTTIPPDAAAPIALPIDIEGIGFISIAQEVIKNGWSALKGAYIEINGTINVNGIPAPFSQRFNLA